MTGDKLEMSESDNGKNLPPLVARGKNVVVTRHNMRIAKRVLFAAFHGLSFPNQEMCQILRDSYLANIANMILYAKENKLNPYNYIASIRSELLKDSRVRRY